jgi:hypothetical protein
MNGGARAAQRIYSPDSGNLPFVCDKCDTPLAKKSAKTSVDFHFFYIFPVSANLMFETDMSIVPGIWQAMMRRIRRISRLDQFRIALMLMR